MKKKLFAIFFAVAFFLSLDRVVCYAEPSEETQEENFVGGVIPNDQEAISIHDENETSVPATYGSTVPSTYDSRNYGYVTSVRDQGDFGTCWAFGALAAGESSLLKAGDASAGSLDLSERHLAYFFYHSVTDPLGNTAGDTTNAISGDNNYLNAGGNNILTMFALAAWKGAADEQTAPYSTLEESYKEYGFTTDFILDTDLTDDLAYTDTFHMQNAYCISMEDRTDVKQMIMQYGAVAVSYCHDYSYYNDKTSSYYKPTLSDENHVVTIVGWNDNYSSENFLSQCRPKHNGAWLVKNSWGTSFGNNGYFWISYEDVVLNQDQSIAFVYDFEPADNYDNNYQYDGASGNSYNFIASGGSIGNIFETTANLMGSESLEAVSFALNDVNVNYSIQIYRNLTNRSNPVSGTPALSSPVTGKTSYAGYYTIPLSESVKFSENTLYSIVVEFTKENGNTICYMVDSSYENGDWISFNNEVAEGQSFEQDISGMEWEDLSNSVEQSDDIYDSQDEVSCSARLKGFTKNSSEKLVSGINLEKTALTLTVGDKSSVNISGIEPEDASDQQLIYASSDAEIVFVDNSGNLEALKAGTVQITVAAADGSGISASCKVTVKAAAVVSYQVTYKLNGGKNNSANPSQYYYGKKVILKDPTRSGYAFQDWYTDSKYKNKITAIAASSKKNLTLYAKWEKITVNKTVINSAKNSTAKQIAVSYKKVSGATGYQITYSTSSKFTAKTTKSVYVTGTSTKLKSLQKGKTYYIKIHAYKIDSAGKKVYGNYTSVKKVKVSK